MRELKHADFHRSHSGRSGAAVPPTSEETLSSTGKPATVTGIVISRYANGQIVETWANWDTLGLLQQLGVIPTPGQESKEKRRVIP